MRWLLIGAGLATVLVGAASSEELPLRQAAADYREGRLMDALRISSEVLASDPENAVAKNYVWTITQEIKKGRARLEPGEVEKADALARRSLEDRRRKTEKVLAELSSAARKSGDLRSPMGMLTALGGLGQSVGPDVSAGARGQIYLDNILRNLQTALDKKVFVSRKDQFRAEGYMAFYKRQWPKAVALWEKALKEDPADAQVKSDLSSLKTLLDKERRDVEMKDLVAQAEAYQQTGLYDRAAESWKEVLRRDPRRPGAAESLAASRAAAEKVRQLKRLDAMNEDAVTLYNQGKHLSAAELWLEALQLDPTYQKARVWLKLVGKKIERGEESAAEPAPRSAPAPAAAPTSESVTRAEQLYKQGLLAYAEGRLEDSVKLWRGALAANPSLKKAQEALRQGESEISLMAK